MEQLRALIWLKWTLFRNTMRSRKAVLSRVASMLGTLAALGLALVIALALGFVVYKVLTPDIGYRLTRLPPGQTSAGVLKDLAPPARFLVFTIFAVIYLMWATVPLSLGGGSRFDAGRLLLYPISLRKLFAIDFMSELTGLGSIFAIPILLAVAIGAGFGNENLLLALPAAAFAIICGIALAKWLSTAVGALMQKRRTRGETVLALIGVVVGLGGVLLGELAQSLARNTASFGGLRWTPPGAAAVALVDGLREGGGGDYALAMLTLAAYTVLLVLSTYFIARRAALGAGGEKRSVARVRAPGSAAAYTGWRLPLVSAQISAVVEKELRYAMRNAQLRMMALMPLVLIGVRLMQSRRFAREFQGRDALPSEAVSYANDFAAYGEGLLVAAGVLYIFLILSSLACNLFAYEGSGMRAFILSPVNRRSILVGKNIAITFLALLFCTVLLSINQLVFHDLSLAALCFAALCFLLFAALFSLIGNWLSMRFPKPLQFGKRMNASGVTAFLLIPLVVGMALPPVLAALAGYLTHSLVVKYVTLALFAAVALALYGLLINAQGRALSGSEYEILEAVSGRNETQG
ncbi:MAG TPA: hypothetical protein VF723_03635 [Pyrinomonadaceae bacterium]|jgi:hypothetical protein